MNFERESFIVSKTTAEVEERLGDINMTKGAIGPARKHYANAKGHAAAALAVRPKDPRIMALAHEIEQKLRAEQTN